MNKLFKRKWLAALRSGKYKQGKGQLRTVDDKYCCLGVLCDIYSRTKVAKASGYKWEGGMFDNERLQLPYVVAVWAGFKTVRPNVMVNGAKRALSEVNDNSDKGFKGIANIIEEQL